MSATYAIQGELTVFTAHELKSAVLAAMQPTGPLELDLSEVTEFDGAGLQLLLATQHEVAARAGGLHLKGAPAKVLAALRLAGLQNHFAISQTHSEEISP